VSLIAENVKTAEERRHEHKFQIPFNGSWEERKAAHPNYNSAVI
jgi:hypothetical protein